MANRAISNDSYIEPHFREWTRWWAQYGLLLPFIALILLGLAGGSMLFSRGLSRERAQTVRAFSTQDPSNDFEPTPEEQNMERRIDELLDQDERQNR